jgi:hypothetical protein
MHPHRDVRHHRTTPRLELLERKLCLDAGNTIPCQPAPPPVGPCTDSADGSGTCNSEPTIEPCTTMCSPYPI